MGWEGALATIDDRGTAFEAVERRDTDGPMPPEADGDAAPEEAGAAEAEADGAAEEAAATAF